MITQLGKSNFGNPSYSIHKQKVQQMALKTMVMVKYESLILLEMYIKQLLISLKVTLELLYCALLEYDSEYLHQYKQTRFPFLFSLTYKFQKV